MIIRNCRFYRGSRPCKFNKFDGSECPTCKHSSLFRSRVLIIKLDALGDVLRTGSLLPIIASRHPAPYITWLTRQEATELVSMMPLVDEVLALDVEGLARIQAGGWDHVYSLSNDHLTASLASLAAPSYPPIGFSLRDGYLTPSNEFAAKWLELAAFDRLKKANKSVYQKIMLDIIGEQTPFGPPRLTVDVDMLKRAKERLDGLFPNSRRKRVAINIGSGQRWPKKMLYASQIAIYAMQLCDKAEADIVLVGGQAELSKASEILALCGNAEHIRAALTTQSIGEFAAVLSQCCVLLCGDTLALHIATAINLPTVCVVGPTSNAELADFDGLVVKTTVDDLECLACYGDCQKVRNCMSLFDIDHLVHLTLGQLARAKDNDPTYTYLLPPNSH